MTLAVPGRKEELAVRCLLLAVDGTVWTGVSNSEQKGAGEMLAFPRESLRGH